MRQIELIHFLSLVNKEIPSYIPTGYRLAYCFSVTTQPKNEPLFSRSKISPIDPGVGQTFQTFTSRKDAYAIAIRAILSPIPTLAWIHFHIYLESTTYPYTIHSLVRSQRLPSPLDPPCLRPG